MAPPTRAPARTRLTQGNEACATAAIMAGVRFFAGYPITPSSEIAEFMAVRLPQVGGTFVQMEDEIASMAAIVGASLCGIKVMTATSGPGFSLKQENIGFACLAEAPALIVDIQRGGPSTGLPTYPSQQDVMQARWGTHGDHPAIALAPASVKEMFDLTIHAVNIAERLRTPVTLLGDEVVAHMREKLTIPHPSEVEIVDRVRPSCSPEEYLPYAADEETGVPPMAAYGDGYRFHVTGLMHDETGFPSSDPENTQRLLKRLLAKVEAAREDITFLEHYYLDDADIGVVAYGVTSRVALRAVRDAREQGIKAGLLDLKTIWPFPDEAVGEVSRQVDVIVAPEMNLGQLRLEIERAAHGHAEAVGVNLASGEVLRPEDILDAITSAARSPVRA
ncbi:MAG: 2-oxoacid:acceptor oxidoreductase subunit alpha [Armatimonadota bacterium]